MSSIRALFFASPRYFHIPMRKEKKPALVRGHRPSIHDRMPGVVQSLLNCGVSGRRSSSPPSFGSVSAFQFNADEGRRFRLNLTNTFPCHRELLADLFQCVVGEPHFMPAMPKRIRNYEPVPRAASPASGRAKKRGSFRLAAPFDRFG